MGRDRGDPRYAFLDYKVRGLHLRRPINQSHQTFANSSTYRGHVRGVRLNTLRNLPSDGLQHVPKRTKGADTSRWCL